MTKDEQVYELHLALKEVIASLEGNWPVPRRKPLKIGHMLGYSRGRGRRAIPGVMQEPDA